MSCLQNFTTKGILNSHKYETGIKKFKNYENQISIPFKLLQIQNVH